jgi:hypothetical protein
MNDIVDNLLVLCVKDLVFRCLTLAVPLLSFVKLKVGYVGRTHDRTESCKYSSKYSSFYIKLKLYMNLHSEIKCVYPNEVRDKCCEQGRFEARRTS